MSTKNIKPGISVEITKNQPHRMGKAKNPSRRGIIERENSIAPGYWYVNLEATNRAKATTELFEERDMILL